MQLFLLTYSATHLAPLLVVYYELIIKTIVDNYGNKNAGVACGYLCVAADLTMLVVVFVVIALVIVVIVIVAVVCVIKKKQSMNKKGQSPQNNDNNNSNSK